MIKNWFRKFLYTKLVSDLELKIQELESKLFQTEQFLTLAEDKIAEWVEKHDRLLFKSKGLDYDKEKNI